MNSRDVCWSAVLISALIMSACGPFGPTDEISVFWPEAGIPALGGEPPDTWELHWLRSDGTRSSCIVDGNSHPVLTLFREYPVVIVGYPRDSSLPNGYRIKPAGCVLPAEWAPCGPMRMSWEDGFAALKILELADAGVSPLSVNVDRFVDAARIRGDDRPWDLDERRLWDDLLTGDIWIYSFKLLPEHLVSLPVAPGLWHGEYPLSPSFTADSDGWEGPFAEGFHRFYCSETGKLVYVDIDADGRATYLAYP